MTDELAAALVDLREAARSETEGCAGRIDGAVARIYELQDADCIGPMLLVLDDDYKFQELMWSITHLAESFDPETYLASLIDVLPQLNASASEWAVRLVVRILNSDPDRGCFAEQVRQVHPERTDIRAAVRAVLDRVAEENPGKLSASAAEVRTASGLC